MKLLPKRIGFEVNHAMHNTSRTDGVPSLLCQRNIVHVHFRVSPVKVQGGGKYSVMASRDSKNSFDRPNSRDEQIAIF